MDRKEVLFSNSVTRWLYFWHVVYCTGVMLLCLLSFTLTSRSLFSLSDESRFDMFSFKFLFCRKKCTNTDNAAGGKFLAYLWNSRDIRFNFLEFVLAVHFLSATSIFSISASFFVSLKKISSFSIQNWGEAQISLIQDSFSWKSSPNHINTLFILSSRITSPWHFSNSLFRILST